MLFHCDSSYNFRRASFSLLRAVELPPKGMGGDTEFADSRTAFVDLPDTIKKDLLSKDYVGCHTLAQSRKLGSPEFFKSLDPSKFPMARHRLTQIHEGSGRTNLYVGAHLHHIEGLPEEESSKLRDTLFNHVTQSKYLYRFRWEQPGDIVMWDNRATLHRAMGGSFAGKYRRDLRRTTVHDDSAFAWGLNDTEGAAAFGYQVGTKNLGNTEAAPTTTTADVPTATNIPSSVPVAAIS
jgi:alpha-ketoglutarate-dependent 2,4-dichlorophenoxyacetate dioxygenase